MKIDHQIEPTSFVENQASFHANDSILSIYNTYEQALRVPFESKELLIGGALSGHKVMRTKGVEKEQHFLPHETYVVAPGQVIEIDFPEANIQAPTTCITVEVSMDKLNQTIDRLHNTLPTIENVVDWQPGHPVLHAHHSNETQALFTKLASLFKENHPDRELMIDLNVTELIIRLLRHKTRDFIICQSEYNRELNGLTEVIHYMQTNLSLPLDINKLCKLSCMSRSSFFYEFKKQLGCSPLAFQQQLRLSTAAKLLKQGKSITQVSYDLGFSSPSHFSRLFKKYYESTPRSFKERHYKI